jgi:hypothetical protein
MSVDVGAGAAWIRGDEAATQPTYRVYSSGTVNLAIGSADATNARIDRVIVEVRDSVFAGADDDCRFRVVAGTPAGSPTAPAEPDNAITLALVEVEPQATEILDGAITDARPVAGVTSAFLQDGAVTNAKLAAGAVTAAKTSGGLGLAAISFINSWVNAGASHHAAGCRKDFLGRVHLRGLISSGTSAAVGFLPSGYRPSARETFPAAAYASGTPIGSYAIEIRTDGSLFLPGDFSYPISDSVSLSGISFEAA